VKFTWDARKGRLNRPGISFEVAMRIFDDAFHVTEQDREVEHEPRWQTIGAVGQNILLVKHTVDEEDNAIRIHLGTKDNARRTKNLCRRPLENPKS
jgi:uncharacterized protein